MTSAGVDEFTGTRLIQVDADMTLNLGDTFIRFNANGQELALHVDSKSPLLWTLPRATVTSASASVADQLEAAGLHLDVFGERGRLASLGSGVDSRLGRLFVGSRAVAPGTPRALLALAWPRLTRRLRLKR